MKKRIFVSSFFIGLLVLFLASCQFSFNLREKDVKNSDLVTPYSNMDDLSVARSITTEPNDPDLVDWRVARYFALVEKIEFESVYPWHGASISKYPVVIYFPDSDKPRYYEFRVIRDGIELGSVTCNASKAEGDPVVYASEMTHQVTAETADRLTSSFSEAKLTAVNYPHQFVMRDANASTRSITAGETQFKDALTGNVLDENELVVPEKPEVFLEKASEKDIEKLNITTEVQEQIREDAEEKKVYTRELWAAIDAEMDKILSMSDEEIEKEFANSNPIPVNPSTRHIYETVFLGTTYYNVLKDWENKVDVPIHGYCSASELAYIVLGLGEKSGMTELAGQKGKSDYEKARLLYNVFVSELNIDEERSGIATLLNARTIGRLKKALEERTNYTMDLNPTGWNKVDDNIRKGYPVLSLRIGGWIRYGTWAMHYRTIIGTKTTQVEEKRKFLWWKIRSTYKNDNWYYIHDNGTEKDFCERASAKGFGCWEKASGSYQTQTGMVRPK